MAIVSVFVASLLWTFATQLFAIVGREINNLRLNFYKSAISLLLFLAVFLLSAPYIPDVKVIYLLLLSGLLGYALGDLLIFRGFAVLGAANTLIITSFGPALVAIFPIYYWEPSFCSHNG